MTKAQFVRWRNRREKAADALREALRQLREMEKINDEPMVRVRCEKAAERITWGLGDLETALNRATVPAPTDNRTKER